MAEDKCKGCQSFCMRGAQVAGQAPGTSTDPNYTGSESRQGSYPLNYWEEWSNLKGHSAGPANATTIASEKGLSENNQKNFTQFIKDTYNEGTHNIADLQSFLSSEEGQKQLQRVQSPPESSDTPTYLCEEDMNSALEGACSKEVVYAHHYNDLTPPLTHSESSSVSIDTLGKEAVTNSLQSGIVAGFSGEKASLKKDDQILASLYIDLANKAKKLLYHPYQCNICNICEGSNWLEVVKEVFEAIAQKKPVYHRVDAPSSCNISANGVTFTLRADCSGAVAACLFAYDPEKIPSDAPRSWSTHGMKPDGGHGPYIASAGFDWVGGTDGDTPGDIQVLATTHTQIIDEDGAASYSGGSTEGLAGKKSDIHNYHYDGVWRDNGSGGSIGSGTYTGSISGGDFGDGTGSFAYGGQEVSAMFTAYYPHDDLMEGGIWDSKDQLLDPSAHTCAAPKDIPYGSYIIPHGTGTWIDDIPFRVNDVGGAINVESGVYHFDILHSSAAECDAFGVRYGSATI